MKKKLRKNIYLFFLKTIGQLGLKDPHLYIFFTDTFDAGLPKKGFIFERIFKKLQNVE